MLAVADVFGSSWGLLNAARYVKQSVRGDWNCWADPSDEHCPAPLKDWIIHLDAFVLKVAAAAAAAAASSSAAAETPCTGAGPIRGNKSRGSAEGIFHDDVLSRQQRSLHQVRLSLAISRCTR